MNEVSTNEKATALINREGVFGFGFSNNNNLDLMNLVVLAISGIIIKLFFEENFTKLGNSGPASTTIWGYGLTAIALFLMIFMAIYMSTKKNEQDNFRILERGGKSGSLLSYYLKVLSQAAFPVFLTFCIVMYLIILNYIYFNRINSNKVSSSYSTYSFFSSLLIVIQIGIIIKYMFSTLKSINTNSDDIKIKNETGLLKGLVMIIITFNFLFALILHILLAFFSTDG